MLKQYGCDCGNGLGWVFFSNRSALGVPAVAVEAFKAISSIAGMQISSNKDGPSDLASLVKGRKSADERGERVSE